MTATCKVDDAGPVKPLTASEDEIVVLSGMATGVVFWKNLVPPPVVVTVTEEVLEFVKPPLSVTVSVTLKVPAAA